MRRLREGAVVFAVVDRLLTIVAGQHVAKLLVALNLPKEVIGQIDERTRGIHERHRLER